MKASLKEELANILNGNIHWDCSLKRYTSFFIGGPAAALVEVDNKEVLQKILFFCRNQKVDWRVIGRGTNLLVNDGGFDGIVILLGKGFGSIDSDASSGDGRVIVRAGAGVGLSKLADWCADRGLAGLEFATGIPGSLGGAVIMNAGAWGGAISDSLDAVEIVGVSGEQVLVRENLHFGYRCWHDFKEECAEKVVTGAVFALRQDAVERVKERCRELREKRKVSQPPGGGTCGSFFKNPENDSAGRLIEACGLKGAKVGGAMVSEKHANFFINTGDATAEDMIRLMEKVRKKVMECHGTALETEVHFL